MAELLYTAFVIWNLLFVFAVICIFLREDYKIVLSEVFGMLIQPNIFLFLVSVMILYVFIPLTTPYSISALIKEKKEKKDDQ
jgi:hypothetical protein